MSISQENKYDEGKSPLILQFGKNSLKFNVFFLLIWLYLHFSSELPILGNMQGRQDAEYTQFYFCQICAYDNLISILDRIGSNI